VNHYIALHTHRHGVSAYIFQADTFTTEDFAEFLGAEYEPDRDDEFLDVERTPIIKWGAE